MKRARGASPFERTCERALVANLLRQSEEYYEFQQPPAGGGVAGNGPLQKPLQYGGRFVAHGPRSLRCGRRTLCFSLFKSGAVNRTKKTGFEISLGPIAAGERNRRQGGAFGPSDSRQGAAGCREGKCSHGDDAAAWLAATRAG